MWSLLLSLVSKTTVCGDKQNAGGLLVSGQGKAAQFRASKETHRQSGGV